MCIWWPHKYIGNLLCVLLHLVDSIALNGESKFHTGCDRKIKRRHDNVNPVSVGDLKQKLSNSRGWKLKYLLLRQQVWKWYRHRIHSNRCNAIACQHNRGVECKRWDSSRCKNRVPIHITLCDKKCHGITNGKRVKVIEPISDAAHHTYRPWKRKTTISTQVPKFSR